MIVQFFDYQVFMKLVYQNQMWAMIKFFQLIWRQTKFIFCQIDWKRVIWYIYVYNIILVEKSAAIDIVKLKL